VLLLGAYLFSFALLDLQFLLANHVNCWFFRGKHKRDADASKPGLNVELSLPACSRETPFLAPSRFSKIKFHSIPSRSRKNKINFAVT